ncbi:MAG: hypothetical protein KC593_24485 [Myxococcales bacterium]|nr:hypothetical protein [Myxococcales bacterium]
MSVFELGPVERAAWEAALRRSEAWRERDAERRLRGVVHTPPELARAMAERAHAALIALGASGGLADESVHLVDPSCGTGTFLAAAHTVAGPGSAATRPWRVSGWDLDQDVLRDARGALGEAFSEAGWPLALDARDTLACDVELPPGGRVVVLGNPPWAARSENRGDARMEALLEDFRRGVDGERLAERKLGVLSDTYVRFLRWACEAVRSAEGGGVVSLVMNASFLDGPVHRGLRGALCRWFDGISVWDLGGSALVARMAGRDDNVFGVRPGVAVLTAWSRGRGAEDEQGAVRARVGTWRVRGTLDEKWAALAAWPAGEGAFTTPVAPLYRFGAGAGDEWPSDYVALPALMPFHQEGVQTNRDDVVVDRDPARLRDRVQRFLAGREDADLARALQEQQHYSPARAREALARAWAEDPARCILPIAYRPFESAYFVPVAPLCHRPRPALIEAMQQSELALVTVRKDRGERPWAHALAVRAIPDNCLLSSRSSCRARAFPTHGPDGAINLDEDVLAAWASELPQPPSAREVIAWALTWLMAPAYQQRFDALLKGDYPAVPPPLDVDEWREGVRLGEELIALCLVDHHARLPEHSDLGHHREARTPWGFERALSAASAFAEARFAVERDAD